MAEATCRRELELEIPAEEVSRQTDKIAKDLMRVARVPGFRPGKAPITLIKKRFAEEIKGEVLQTLVPEKVEKAVAEQKLTPVSQPQVDKLDYNEGQAVKFRAVFEVLPEFEQTDSRRKLVTGEMLLAHSSGLPAYVKLFQQAKDRASLLQLAFQVPLEQAPGTLADYSDIGFILLGELLQRISRDTLDCFARSEVFAALEMPSTCFRPGKQIERSIPPTRDDQDFRHRVVQGEVHDENASQMGGVAGHAGLFSNTADLMKFSCAMLGLGTPLFRLETIELFTRRQATPPKTSRALGWDTPSSPSQSGKHFSARSFGHLGYTGTSLWIDAEQRIAIALLTNRTWPDNQSQLIKQIRPAFHDAVMEELLKIS